MLPNFTANTLVLIRESLNVEAVKHSRPISMVNFKFEIITKVLAVRLAQTMPFITSKEQNGPIHRRKIRDCVCLASENC